MLSEAETRGAVMKLIFIGDLHIRGSNPRNRIDDYKEAAKEKLREVFELAEAVEATAIICPGDVFNQPVVSIAVLLEFARLFQESPVPIYSTIGNHDVFGYNLDTFERTSLKLLEMLVPQLHIKQDYVHLGSELKPLGVVTFQPYTNLLDINGYGYSYDIPPQEKQIHIHVAHAMLMDHTPPFDRYCLRSVDMTKTCSEILSMPRQICLLVLPQVIAI